MRVSDAMSRDVASVSDTATLAGAIRLMWENDIGFVPVLREGTLVGVVTDRDAVIAAWSQDRPPSQISVGTAMSAAIVSCHPDDDVYEAERLMQTHQVHRLPVLTHEGALVGVLSINDLARRAARESDTWMEENVAATLSAISAPRH